MNDVLATATLAVCRARGERIVTAESCTGGLVSASLTAIAGSSDVVERGFVTYSNDAKMEMLGVHAETLEALLESLSALSGLQLQQRMVSSRKNINSLITGSAI